MMQKNVKQDFPAAVFSHAGKSLSCHSVPYLNWRCLFPRMSISKLI